MAGGGSGAGQQAGKGRQMGWLRHVLTVLSVFIFVSFEFSSFFNHHHEETWPTERQRQSLVLKDFHKYSTIAIHLCVQTGRVDSAVEQCPQLCPRGFLLIIVLHTYWLFNCTV